MHLHSATLKIPISVLGSVELRAVMSNEYRAVLPVAPYGISMSASPGNIAAAEMAAPIISLHIVLRQKPRKWRRRRVAPLAGVVRYLHWRCVIPWHLGKMLASAVKRRAARNE